MRDTAAYASAPVAAMHVAGAVDVSAPVPGFYRAKLRGNGIAGGVRIWFGPPLDPETGEELDRSHRFQAEFNGDYVEIDDVWPVCAGDPISEPDYHNYRMRAVWARRNAPRSAYADPKRRYDPLSNDNPLPFS